MADVLAQASELVEKIQSLRETLRVDEKKATLLQLEAKMSELSFWVDQQSARSIASRVAVLKKEIDEWDSLLADARAYAELAAGNDAALTEGLGAEIEKLEKQYGVLEFRAFFSGTYDEQPALVALHAGTGGVDAMDWAEMLLRMYVRFCERMGWKVTMLDKQSGGEAGIKTATFEVQGPYAYGYLKSENGVHRLVRISPFDAEGMRHTSFALAEVIPDLGDREETIVRGEDLKIDVYRASGHGGQGVNTTDSAVRITHIPTGIVVTCQNERSQTQNKETALRYLRAKLARMQELEREEERKVLRGAYNEAAWGNQIRSYVLNPYRLVKDHRTGVETQNVLDVLDGELLPFIEGYLRGQVEKKETQ